MPIAFCYTNKEIPKQSDEIIQRWADYAKISSKEMTLNFVATNEQIGKNYPLMVQLYLPDLWQSTQINQIQLGLAKALCEAFSLHKQSVHIISHIIAAGLVCENGEIQHW